MRQEPRTWHGLAYADCPDFESVLQAYGRHVGKEVLVCSPGLLDCDECFGSVVMPRLNDSGRRDMSRNGPRGLVIGWGSEFVCRGGGKM